jgi:hypothetical protein
MEAANLNYRPVVLAVAVATAGVLQGAFIVRPRR